MQVQPSEVYVTEGDGIDAAVVTLFEAGDPAAASAGGGYEPWEVIVMAAQFMLNSCSRLNQVLSIVSPRSNITTSSTSLTRQRLRLRLGYPLVP